MLPIPQTITVTPGGKLRIDKKIASYVERLFALGAAKHAKLNEACAFWHRFAVNCLIELSKLPERGKAAGARIRSLPFPGEPQEWLANAPIMPGIEYLDEDNLRQIWNELTNWTANKVTAASGVDQFLQEYAPEWLGIGRIYFHLGENRLDEEKPFAFLATVGSGLTKKGVLRHMPLAIALKGEEDVARARQVEILTRLDEAAALSPWVDKILDTGDIYKPMAITPDEAHEFMISAPSLEEAGYGIRLPDWWKKRPRLRVEAELSTRESANMMGAQSLLDFDIHVALGEQAISDEELDAMLAASSSLVLVKNQWVEIDRERLLQAISHWRRVKEDADRGGLSFNAGMRMLAGLDLYASDMPKEEVKSIRQWSHVNAGRGLKELLQSARQEVEDSDIPELRGELRPYQAQGVSWLRFLSRLGLGACLADDMGLGKTIQILALLLRDRQPDAMPTLLIAPASLLASWKYEIQRFAPSLRVLFFHASEMSPREIASFNDAQKLRQYDLVITSYAMNTRLAWLGDMEWSRVIADEAQNIKNAQTRQSQAVRKLKAPSRIALTGTPIENSLNDLWTLFDFINPGLLGSAKEFEHIRKQLSEAGIGLAPLRKLTSPYIMRRMKSDKNIISTLPDKAEMPLYCNLSKEQAKLYGEVVDNMRKSLNELSGAPEDRNRRNMLVLKSIMLLKQICNHPAQAGAGGEYSPERSGKFQCLGDLCREIAERQEKVLVFTQFREIIPAISALLEGIFGAPGLVLHGGVPVKKRGELVREFQQEDGPPFFILSLKAGGTGLTLTEASHVIHFDRWWNPAVENQATDRAYRIGQQKNVLVHKCLTLGTLEEKIASLIESKKDLAAQMLDNIDNNITTLSDDEIMQLVSLDVRRALA